MKDFPLSDSGKFWYRELIHTNHRRVNNSASQDVIDRACRFTAGVLDPIRAHYKKPLVVHSWYRSPRLNRKIGGSRSSHHCAKNGMMAIDFHIIGRSFVDIFCDIAAGKFGDWDQLIFEFNRWIHLSKSYGPRPNRRMVLAAYKRGRRTKYATITEPSKVLELY